MASLSQLDSPRFTSCSFFPYTLSDNAELTLLLRNRKDSKNSPYYIDFGTTLKDKDANILFAACRSFISKTAGGLCLASELDTVNNYNELERKIKEHIQKSSNGVFSTNGNLYDVDNLTKKKMHEVFQTIIYNNH